MGFWTIADRVIDQVDIVLLIVDARMPEMSDNKLLRDIINQKKKQLVLVFNKKDLVSEEAMFELKRQYPYAFFVSGIKNEGVSRLKTGLMIMAKRSGLEKPRIGVVGYPNVGKSAIINAMAHRARAAVSTKAGTTRGVQWVRVGALQILDSPGVIPYKDSDVKLGIIGAKNPEKIRNEEKVACKIIEMIVEKNKAALEEFYSIKLEDNEDKYDTFLKIGEKRKFLLKGGKIDEHRTAIQIINDWTRGKIKV